jgi:hypothetical protein
VIERILRHCGLWHTSTPRPPPAAGGYDPDFDSDSRMACSDGPRKVTFVDMDTFWATF